ncbi:MAG: hypothetical protein V1834_03365 [Candidatus Micrarchaeota archaeon]
MDLLIVGGLLAVLLIAAVAVLVFRSKEQTRKKPYFIDAEEGAVLVLGAPSLELTLTSFRKAGNEIEFDLLARNTGPDEIKNVKVVLGDGSTEITGLKPAELQAKRFKLTKGSDSLGLKVYRDSVQVYSVKLPFISILHAFSKHGKLVDLTLVEHQRKVNEKELRAKIIKDFEARVESSKPADSIEMELDAQEQEVQRKFMKRELNSDTYYKLMQDIEKRKVEIVAKKKLKRLS